MKVLVSDNLGEAGIRILKEADLEVDVKTGLSPDELNEIIGDYDGLIIRSATKVTEDLLSHAHKLKVVGRAGIGLDNVDIPAASKKGVVVMNTPGGNVVTTAEHAISLMLSMTRNIPQGTMTLKDGRWEKKKLQGREIFNKTMGVIGFGKIGSVFADRARGLKMRVIVYDPVVQPDKVRKLGFESVTLDELYEQSDYISIHVPKNANTLGMLNKTAFGKMKDGVMIVNCARGGIIDETALYEAMTLGKVAAAALDVFETEPPPADLPLLTLDNFITTPHLGASTLEAQTNVAVAVANQMIEYLQNNNIINAVNAPSVSGQVLEKLSPFIYLADRMGALQAQSISGQIRSIDLQYNGDFFGFDLAPVTTSYIKGLLSFRMSDEVNSVNAPHIAKEMGIRVTESSTPESSEFMHLVTAKVETTEMNNKIAGTVFGKSDSRIVRYNDFHIEIIPQGHLALIHNRDVPGAIGSIGNTLGNHNINISRMQVGRAPDGQNNIILLRTDTPLTDAIVEEVRNLEKVKSIRKLEL